jgi:asparagine synthase (glutamine-hydrolysing)
VGGITGIVHFRGEPPSRDQVKQLSAGVAHRGPDDKNIFYAAPIGLAQRVFATERDAAKPPFINDRFVILIDGSADRERTLEEWANKGPGALASITNGFALTVWDQKERVLWLARDPTGTRPLFFSHQGSKFAFASTLRPLLGLPWVSREIASDHLTEYLSFRYTHAPRTLLRDVQSVPPGHVARIDSSGVRIDRWWNPPWWSPGQTIPEFPMIADRIDTALRRAVERRLRTIQPTGVLLSGGLDSAAILHHATELLGSAPATFTVTMAGDKRDESAFAARVAETYGAKHSLIKVTTEDMISSVEQATLEMGQPLPSPAALVQHCLFQQIRHETRILLSGAGGDEVLGGRTMPDIAQRLRRARTVGRLPGPARSIGRRLAKRAGLSDLASSASYFGLERKIGGSRVFSADDRVALLRDPAMARPGIRTTILEPIYQEVTSDPINEMLHVWQRGWLTEDVLARADRLAANNRLHIRFPLLDSEFLATAASIPGFEKCRRKGVGYISKAPLRHAMQGRLSEQLLHRPKRAEPRPMAYWLRGQGSPFLRERIDALCDQSADIFVPDVVRTIMEEHLSGQTDHSVQLWTLVMFGAWRSSLG